MLTLREFVERKKICIAAHRGASGTAPENTMAAFREALHTGADMIEIDVQFTADGKAVVYHDATLRRTGNSGEKLDNLNYDKIKELDAGSWFDSKFSGERIPLLIEVLEFVKDRAYLSIEIKARKTDDRLRDNLSKLVTVINEFSLVDYIVFASFNYNALKMMKEINDKVHVAAIKIPGMDIKPSQIAEEIGIEAFICSVDELNEELSKDAKAGKVLIGVYNADTPQDIKTSLDFDVWAIGTNYPQMAIAEIMKIAY